MPGLHFDALVEISFLCHQDIWMCSSGELLEMSISQEITHFSRLIFIVSRYHTTRLPLQLSNS